MKVTPTPETLGANVEGIDLGQPLGQAAFGGILRALGAHGVLCFPRQSLDAHQLRAFSAHFGGLQASLTGTYCEPGMPEVMVHNAIPDYGPDEHRLIKRCQVMADRVFDPVFVRQALLQAAG